LHISLHAREDLNICGWSSALERENVKNQVQFVVLPDIDRLIQGQNVIPGSAQNDRKRQEKW
jgi:hypothetical protein